MRNCAVTMVAPTGTTSLLANASSGIEPVFSLVTKRRTFFEDDEENRPTRELVIVDPLFEEYLKENYKKEERERILKEVAEEDYGSFSEKEKGVYITTHRNAPEWHVKVQAAWQKHFDNSISKTINFSNEATVEDVKDAYMLAWKKGCKGITIYRDGSKEDQVLRVSENEGEEEVATEKDHCPECGGRLKREERCLKCYDCGWSVCG